MGCSAAMHEHHLEFCFSHAIGFELDYIMLQTNTIPKDTFLNFTRSYTHNFMRILKTKWRIL